MSTPRFPTWRCLPLLLTGALTGFAEPSAVVVPRVTHPGAGQTIYILMPDRFANGDPANDRGGLKGGVEDHGFDPTRTGYFHGGDFAGLTAKLDYIRGLNVSTVWTTPPYKNNPVQAGSAGYHGYWPVDFLSIDPHFGTNDEYKEFMQAAHARGLRVYLDIVVNHTADIIQYESGKYGYVPKAQVPFRDAHGQPFDERALAYNGLNDPASFPALSLQGSFPNNPLVRPGAEQAKNPAWLNDLTLYHNRGDSTFQGESAVLGDFAGLDDVMTEHPRVVRGFIELFREWIDRGVDGFRIDTMRHANAGFWQAFNPAMRAHARAKGRPDFIQFGEVMNEAGDVPYLSGFSTGTMPVDALTDFGFAAAARKYLSQGAPAAGLADFFARDDYYTDHDSNVHANVTLLGNYDIGRWGYFLMKDNPGASLGQLADLARLGHGLLYLSRGMPTLHYGDEQGMIGRGGWDQQAREDMFASQTPAYRDAPLLGTTRTGADDKFDPQHPFYRLFARLGQLRREHAALRTGAMILRPASEPNLFAFSRIDRGELVEYVAVFNNSRFAPLTASIPTSQPAGASFVPLFDSQSPESAPPAPVATDANGALRVSVAPLQFAVWRAARPLVAPANAPSVRFVTPADGGQLSFESQEIDHLLFPGRRELRVEVTGGDGVAEVTFVMMRASRPDQFEFLGTDDAAPYRVFWNPPSDLAPGEKVTFTATLNDLRGHTASTSVAHLTAVPGRVPFGIPGATCPQITAAPSARISVAAGAPLELAVTATGSGELEYQWYRNDEPIAGATGPLYRVAAASASDAGRYRVGVHNFAGTTLSLGADVVVEGAGRIARHDRFPSAFVPARTIDVWLPPDYDSNPERRYPVIYMHDGQNAFDSTRAFGGVAWEIDRSVLRLKRAGKTDGAIVVAVHNIGIARFHEFMPQKAVRADPVHFLDGMPTVPAAQVDSDAYLKFLVTEVKPFIDRSYRTRPETAHTSLLGSSMGGLISVYGVTEYPAVFGNAACVSTHWPAGKGEVVDYLAQHLPDPASHRLYFDFGTATLDAAYEPFQQRVDAALRAAGYVEGRNWITRKFAGAEHSERSWRERVDIPLEFLLRKP